MAITNLMPMTVTTGLKTAYVRFLVFYSIDLGLALVYTLKDMLLGLVHNLFSCHNFGID